MRSRKGAAPPQSASPANPQPAAQVAPKAAPPKTTAPVGKPVPAAPSEPVKRAASAQAPAAQAATAKPASSPAKPVPQVQAKLAPQPPTRQPPLEPVKVQRSAPASPASPAPFNHFPRAAAPVQKTPPTPQNAQPVASRAPSAPVSRRTAENPAPRAAPAVQSVKGRPMATPTPQAQALPGRATQVPTNVPAMPASVRQSAQAPSAAPPPAAAPPAVKRPLGRPRKAAPLTPADVADIVQADLPDTSPAVDPVPVAEAIAETRAAQEAAGRVATVRLTPPPGELPKVVPITVGLDPLGGVGVVGPTRTDTVLRIGGPDPSQQSKPGRSFGAPSAPLAAKQHQALCAYSAQVKTLATEAEIAAAAQALGADDLVVLRQVDRLRRLGGHSRTLCATDDAAVDRLTRAGIVVVLPWNGPKPPKPACYAELTPAGAAVVALLPQPPRSAAQESEETTKTLQRYVERKPGRPPGKD